MAANQTSNHGGHTEENPPMQTIGSVPVVTEDVKRKFRDDAAVLVHDINIQLASGQLNKDSDAAKLIIAAIEIAGLLKKGNANIEKCNTCSFYKWKTDRDTNFWDVVCHDPKECPAVDLGVLRNNTNMPTRNSLGFRRTSNVAHNQSVSQNDLSVLRK